MTKEQKLDAIYEAMADKTLSDGCTIFNKISETNDIVGSIGITVENRLFLLSFDDYMEKDEYKIIGHPVRIGDVLGSLTRDSWHLRDELFGKWSKFKLPIDDQSEECIDFVYSLITK